MDLNREIPLFKAQGAHFKHCTDGRTIACSFVPPIATRMQDLASKARGDTEVEVAPGEVGVKICFSAEQWGLVSVWV